jgi:hypothetical protein
MEVGIEPNPVGDIATTDSHLAVKNDPTALAPSAEAQAVRRAEMTRRMVFGCLNRIKRGECARPPRELIASFC